MCGREREKERKREQERETRSRTEREREKETWDIAKRDIERGSRVKDRERGQRLLPYASRPRKSHLLILRDDSRSHQEITLVYICRLILNDI